MLPVHSRNCPLWNLKCLTLGIKEMFNDELLYFRVMKSIDWKLGLKISAALSLIAVSFRMMQGEKILWETAWSTCLFNFIDGLSCWYVHNMLLAKREQLDDNSPFYPFLSIVITGMLLVIFDWMFSLLPYESFHFVETSGIKKYFSLVFRGLLISSFYYFIVYHLYIQRQKQLHQLEIEQLKQARLDANLASLKEQLSPHFLFNTLNTLSSLSQEDAVKEYVTELANVYRYSLTHQKMDVVTLREELAFMNSYLYIIKTRMEEAIEILVDIDDCCMNTLIPPLTMQLFIENAVKHNVASVSKPLRVMIKNEEGFLTVSNTIQLRPFSKPSTGIGLVNVQHRYQLLFDKPILINKSEDFFTIKVPIIYP